MQQELITLILAMYALEGINKQDVAIIATRTDNSNTIMCMAPQQHSACRAKQVRDRIRRRLSDEAYKVYTQHSRIYSGSEVQNMHAVIIDLQPAEI